MRKAFNDAVPDKILSRTDKMGFVFAEKRWLKEKVKDWFTTQFLGSVEMLSDFVQTKKL